MVGSERIYFPSSMILVSLSFSRLFIEHYSSVFIFKVSKLILNNLNLFIVPGPTLSFVAFVVIGMRFGLGCIRMSFTKMFVSC